MKTKNSEEQLTGSDRMNTVTTKEGKARATFTLKCKFLDGNIFTYRSDVNLENYNKQGYKGLSELEAIILKFTSIQGLILECRLFDNRKPSGENVLLHYSGVIKKVLFSNLPQHYQF
jgi:hypothetical protein